MVMIQYPGQSDRGRSHLAVLLAFGFDQGIRLGECTTLDILNEGLTRFEQFCREH